MNTNFLLRKKGYNQSRQYLKSHAIPHTPMRTATLTKKEDEFWEGIYNQLVSWGIHENLTYDLCLTIIKAKFRRLKDAKRLI